jgi:type VI secretion system protein ImpC
MAEPLADPAAESVAPAIAPQATELNEFEALLTQEFKPKTTQAQEAVTNAVRTLASQALGHTQLISKDVIQTIEGIIAEIDRKLSEQINKILHHEDFKALEGTWRGLHHLVSNTETDETLKIRVMNLSKKDAARTLKKFKGTAWDQSPLFKKVYEEEFGTPGGTPYGCLIGDYQFDHSPPDVEMLSGFAQIAAASHAPFITASAPTLMNMESWQELSNPRDLTKIFQTPEYAPWRSLRESENARYLGLTMPRFLSRLPYSPAANPVEEFAFEEDTEGADHSKFVWSNSAYAMGTNITRAFKLNGWCSRIRGVESGGMVEGLPCHSFPTDDGGVDMKCPTEIAITDRREAELAKNGMMPLSHWKNTDYAVFVGAQSLQKPAVYDDPDATSNANLAARLPYLFATCRFAHYLKCIVRDKIGSFKERTDMQRWLNEWITNFVTSDPNASESQKAKYPLAAAEVVVEEVPGNPGYYTSKFFLKPHFQLEGLTVSLRLVSKLPSAKAGGG